MLAAPMENIETKISSESYLGNDGGSTQVGTPPSQSQQLGTSQGTCDEMRPGDMYGDMPLTETGCTLYLEDLQSFRRQVQQSLLNAYQALESTDDDLAKALRRILQQVADLIETTAAVVKTQGPLAQRLMYDVLPRLRFATTQGDESTQTAHMTVQQMAISKMKNDAKVVRANYLNLLEAVQYLMSCTQLALDFYSCNEASPPQALGFAMTELRRTYTILADPSDFWLIFHITELELGRIENSTQIFSKIQAGHLHAKNQLCVHICDSLEQLFTRYLIPGEQC